MYSRAPPHPTANGAPHSQQPQPHLQHPQHTQHHLQSDRSGAVAMGRLPCLNNSRNNSGAGGAGVAGIAGGVGGVGGMGVCGIKVNRFKGKRLYPSVPNQPSEASAHFMFELAKTALTKAGGNSSTSLFTQPINSQVCSTNWTLS